MESDCATMMNKLHRKGDDLSSIPAYTNAFRSLAGSASLFGIVAIFRNENIIVDVLIKYVVIYHRPILVKCYF